MPYRIRSASTPWIQIRTRLELFHVCFVPSFSQTLFTTIQPTEIHLSHLEYSHGYRYGCLVRMPVSIVSTRLQTEGRFPYSPS